MTIYPLQPDCSTDCVWLMPSHVTVIACSSLRRSSLCSHRVVNSLGVWVGNVEGLIDVVVTVLVVSRLREKVQGVADISSF